MSEEEVLVVDGEALASRLDRLDPQLKLDPEVESALQLAALDFVEEAAAGAASLARHRGAGGVAANDLASHLAKEWGMRVAAFRSETRDKMEETGREQPARSAHRDRLALKATLQEEAEEA